MMEQLTQFIFKVLVKGTDTSLITRVDAPLAVETNFCVDELIVETCLESSVI